MRIRENKIANLYLPIKVLLKKYFYIYIYIYIQSDSQKKIYIYSKFSNLIISFLIIKELNIIIDNRELFFIDYLFEKC